MDYKKPEFKKITDYIWEIGTDFKQGMLVPARIYASKNVLDSMDIHVYDQITNVATLPGIVKYAYCMPDGHSGYGFPIGGVAAMDINDNGVISPGGIGFDINCGMRLIRTDLTYKDVQPKLRELLDKLFKSVPAGVGSRGFVRLDATGFRKVVEEGSEWCIKEGYGWSDDLEVTELGGREKEALRELMRVTRRYLILLEPAYEFASKEAKKRMRQHGYVRNLYAQARSLSFRVLEHRPFDVSVNPLNPTGLLVIQAPRAKKIGAPANPFACPITRAPLEQIKNAYFSKKGLFVYPVIDGVPCLLQKNAVIATHFLDKFSTI